MEDIKPFKRIEKGKQITLYISKEEKALKELALDERRLARVVSKSNNEKPCPLLSP